jgi:hypothetical protein
MGDEQVARASCAATAPWNENVRLAMVLTWLGFAGGCLLPAVDSAATPTAGGSADGAQSSTSAQDAAIPAPNARPMRELNPADAATAPFAPAADSGSQPTAPNVCQPNPCQHNGVCNESQGHYICNCEGTDHEGETCERPRSQCASGSGGCHPDATCESGVCTCRDGLTGDGIGAAGCRVPIVQIKAGNDRTCALTELGTVYCWGRVFDTTEHNMAPTQVAGLSSVRALASGDAYAFDCALLDDGSVRCWGVDHGGSLNGVVSGDERVMGPVAVVGLTNVTSLAQGWPSCAVASGELQCWGPPDTLVEGEIPPTLRRVGSFAGRAVEVVRGIGTTCVVLDDGSAQCWGGNTQGVVGAAGPPAGSNPAAIVTSPLPVTVASDIAHIALGATVGCALLRDRTLRCWGEVTNSTTSMVSAMDYGVTNVVSISASINHVSAVTEDGRVHWWDNGPGTRNALEPLDIDAKQVSIGADHACALLRDSRVYCWGGNKHGQLGDGTTEPRTGVVLAASLAP